MSGKPPIANADAAASPHTEAGDLKLTHGTADLLALAAHLMRNP